jgi:hypothetical protein
MRHSRSMPCIPAALDLTSPRDLVELSARLRSQEISAAAADEAIARMSASRASARAQQRAAHAAPSGDAQGDEDHRRQAWIDQHHLSGRSGRFPPPALPHPRS